MAYVLTVPEKQTARGYWLSAVKGSPQCFPRVAEGLGCGIKMRTPSFGLMPQLHEVRPTELVGNIAHPSYRLENKERKDRKDSQLLQHSYKQLFRAQSLGLNRLKISLYNFSSDLKKLSNQIPN